MYERERLKAQSLAKEKSIRRQAHHNYYAKEHPPDAGDWLDISDLDSDTEKL